MSAESEINKLLEIHPKGFDLSLGRVSELLEKLGKPHLNIPPTFHVAGTNGKGSTSAFLRALLEAAKKTVHVHTSPHLVNWHERYRLGSPDGGRFVSDDQLEDAVKRAAQANHGKPITVFEIMSAVAFLLFSENDADYSVLEVGLGGRFDATNVIPSPLVSIITPVALDHQTYLGDTIEKIAFEKAGIIKPGVPVVVGGQQDAAFAVIEDVANKNRSDVWRYRQDFDGYEQRGRFIYQDESGLLDLPLPNLQGIHQLENAATAIAATRVAGLKIENPIFEKSMWNVVWPGRFERLEDGKLTDFLSKEDKAKFEIWIDGGHNPQAGESLSRELSKLPLANDIPTIMICGMLLTKDPTGFFENFNSTIEEVYTVPIEQSDAAIEPSKLSDFAQKVGLKSTPSKNVSAALKLIADRYSNSKAVRIIICGSLYLVGQVLEQNETSPK